VPPESSATEIADPDATTASDTVLVVAADGSADHTTIGEAVAQAEHGDVVRVEPVLERLTAHPDEPVPFDFVRLYGTQPGTIVRESISSVVIQANRGAQALIEDNLLIRQEPGAPGAGVALARYDTFLRIVGNELNYVDVASARAEIVGNDIHGARSLVSQSKATSSFKEGTCGVSALPGVVLLTENRIHDNETGVCGQVQVVDGEFYDNDVGIWTTGLNGSKTAEEMMEPASIRDAVIRGNEVGIRAGLSSVITLSGVALCDNGVDVEDEGAAVLEQLEPAECES
jgi:hypothetical protein